MSEVKQQIKLVRLYFHKSYPEGYNELYQFLLKGFTNEQIFTEIYISIKTVKKSFVAGKGKVN